MRPNYKAPNAKQILRADAPRDEWLGMRRRGLGGSDMAVITGHSTYAGQSPYLLWVDKTDPEPPTEVESDLFWFGQEVEPILAARFTSDTGIDTRRTGMWQERANEWALANPDRFTADGGILEIKTTTRFTANGKLYLDGEIPDAHRDQLTWYMHVTGRHIGHVITLVDRTVVILPLEWDPHYAERLHRAGWEFWQHVTDLTPPPFDLATVTPEEVSSRFPEVIDPESTVEAPIPEAALDDVATLAALKADAKADAEAIKAVETRLKALTGDKEYLTVNGRPIVRWQTIAGKRSFDADAVLRKIAADRGVEPTKAVLAEIKAEYTKQGAPTRRLTLIEQEVAA